MTFLYFSHFRFFSPKLLAIDAFINLKSLMRPTFQSNIQLELLLLFSLFVFAHPLSLRHSLWYEKWKEEIATPFISPFQTKHWKYCDLKCFYLQNYFPYDFVVITFKQDAYRPDFNACYVKSQESQYGYTIWFKKIKNEFYEQACGMDMEDYLQSPNQYKIIEITGEGKQF